MPHVNTESLLTLFPVYADWCGPCKTIAPVYEKLSAQYSRKDVVTFVRVNTDNVPDLTAKHSVSAYGFHPHGHTISKVLGFPTAYGDWFE